MHCPPTRCLAALFLVLLATLPAQARSAALPPGTFTIRTLPVGPASVGASVSPAFAVDRQGTVYFFGGSCGAKPESCWCDVLEQRPGQPEPRIIAGHIPGTRGATPAQRVPISGCASIAVDKRGIVRLLAADLTHAPNIIRAVLVINPVTGTYREQAGCARCNDSSIAGPVHSVNLYGIAGGAAFGPGGNTYLANDEHHVIQKLAPDGLVSVVMRPHCRSDYENGALVEIKGCVECANSSVDPNGDVYMCPEWPAIGPRGGIYYVDADDNTVRMIDPHSRYRLVAGGGGCRLWLLARCRRGVRATGLWLRDPASDGPRSLALDAGGNLYITLWAYLLEVSPSGLFRVLAGNGRVLLNARGQTYGANVPATRAPITAQAVALDPQGHVYFLDNTGAIRELVR